MSGDNDLRICSMDKCPPSHLHDKVTCFVCKLLFHAKCYGLKPDELQAVGGDCNFQFVCDSCIALYKPIYPTFIDEAKREIASFKTMILAIRKAVATPQPAPVNEDTTKMLSSIHEMVANDATSSLLSDLITEVKTVVTDILNTVKKPPPVVDTVSNAEIKSLLLDIQTAVKTKPKQQQHQPQAASSSGVNNNVRDNSNSNSNYRRNDGMPQANSNRPPNANAPKPPVTRDVIPTSNVSIPQLTASIAPTRKTIVVSRLHPSTTEARIVDYIKSKLGLTVGTSNLVAKALIPRGRLPEQLNFISVKIDVPFDLYPRLMAGEIWPEGVMVRDFEIRPGKSSVSGVFLE